MPMETSSKSGGRQTPQPWPVWVVDATGDEVAVGARLSLILVSGVVQHADNKSRGKDEYHRDVCVLHLFSAVMVQIQTFDGSQ
jgi:hypothetical protein